MNRFHLRMRSFVACLRYLCLNTFIYGCRFFQSCHRVLESGGILVLLTPNIATFFTAALILLGKMPSSDLHPDSETLLAREEPLPVRSDTLVPDVEADKPVHRHLVVFSFLMLRDYLRMIEFDNVKGFGFGLYPFLIFIQPVLKRIDPFHCHQMVFVVRKCATFVPTSTLTTYSGG